MQLNLFEDNRSAILLNIANEFIHSRDLVQAVSVYQQLLAEFPGDKSCSDLRKLVESWHEVIHAIDTTPDKATYLHTIWLQRESIFHPVLRSVVESIVTEQLRALPNPELIFIPPRFHLGQVLLEVGRHADAADCFQAALSTFVLERGKFMAWRGDALTLAGNNNAAIQSYLAALLEDPHTVDMLTVKNVKIIELYESLHYYSTDEIAEEEETAWLPAWGWLKGVFALQKKTLPDEPERATAEFEALVAEGNRSAPRLWFDMLAFAEELRITNQNGGELAVIRRLMKKTNGFMFDCYLQKISGRR